MIHGLFPRALFLSLGLLAVSGPARAGKLDLYDSLVARRKAHGAPFDGPYAALMNHPQLCKRKLIGIDAGNGNVRAEAEDDERAEREPNPPLQLLGLRERRPIDVGG